MGNKPSRIQSSEHATNLNQEDAFDSDSVTKCTIDLTPDLIKHLNDLEKAKKPEQSADASYNEKIIQMYKPLQFSTCQSLQVFFFNVVKKKYTESN